MKIKIGKNLIGEKEPCFIIAEAGVNHNGDIELAKKLINIAKEANVNVIKFQTFQSEKIVTPDAEQAEYQSKNIGQKESQYAMLKRLELSYSDFWELKKYCDQQDIIFLSTPHSSKEDVNLVSEICPAIKERDLEAYFKNIDEVFGIIKKAIENKNIYKLLKGPVAHAGFKRLT